MTETKTENLFQLCGWNENREEVPYPYMVAKNSETHGKNWETLAEGTQEQMLAYWKLLDPVSWAKEERNAMNER
jgi:hypothetical protein